MTSIVRELQTLADGRREWIPSCSANLEISLEDRRTLRVGVSQLVWFPLRCAEDWLDQAASAVREFCELVPERRETDKAWCMSLAMVCKNDALDVVKKVTRKRGCESWRKLV